jgi:hypothetical protein
MYISCVHRNVTKDLSLAAEESSHLSLPHLVVLPIEVRRTQSPFLVHHFWTLDWLESRKIQTDSGISSRTELATRLEGGSEWEPIKILLEGDCYSNKMNPLTKTRLRLNY